jgi:outer membrane protein OmpA-like peptidoglycan-associated protein
MKKLLMVIPMFALVAGGSTACATKGFVKSQVDQVSAKVDSLSQALEATQERTKANEAKLSDHDSKLGAVDAKAGAAQSAADSAASSAGTANSAASQAGKAAMTAQQTADATSKQVNKLVFEVVLNESEGNFKTGQSVLPDAAKAKIDEVISQLKADPKGAYFEIEGHTDNTGDKDYNNKLGMARAEAVRQYLYEQHQVPLFKMNVISYGDTKPVADNKTAAGRAQNRRVVIRVLG